MQAPQELAPAVTILLEQHPAQALFVQRVFSGILGAGHRESEVQSQSVGRVLFAAPQAWYVWRNAVQVSSPSCDFFLVILQALVQFCPVKNHAHPWGVVLLLARILMFNSFAN